MITFIRFCTLLFAFTSFVQGNCLEMPSISGEVNIAYDDFHGIAEGSWNGNTGGLVGANVGLSFCDLVGAQLGGSYGVYDWYGRGAVGPGNPNGVQQQSFVTAGLFYETPYWSGIQAGVVVDWMFNKNFGVFALNPNFGQVRYQAGYLVDCENEWGVLGTCNIHTDHRKAFEVPISFRAIDQVSLFWRHFFETSAETMIWVGVPYRKSLMFPGKRAGQYLVGASFRLPLTSCLMAEAHGVYMGPSGNFASRKYRNNHANICMGITYVFDLCGEIQARPYLPLANNSNFLSDTNLND